jgi:acetoin utilization deacetylase AcuC-like enzyme
MLSVIYSDEFLDHKTGRYHPEKPERLTVIVNALKSAAFAEKITWLTPTPAPARPSLIPTLLKAHDPAYINKVKEIATSGGGYLDGDTPVSSRSYDVALLAVSAWLDGVNTVLTSGNPAFVLARPPGHHAERNTGMGFCLFSHAAIAALYALEQPGVNRVAILDWDVHHGNGTQAIVETHPQIAYCSLHQYPYYPGTGAGSEGGLYDNVLNLPIPPGSNITVYQPLIETKVIPFLAEFQADLLIVSAGYDANQSDPLSNINLQPQDYALFTNACLGLTRKILFGLEGGYDFTSLSQSVLATMETCLI